MVRINYVVALPGFSRDETAVAGRAGRAYNPAGVVRQAAATPASGDRTARLRALNVPTL